MSENPIGLFHNIVRDGALTAGTELAANLVSRIADDTRFTKWVATSAADTYIEVITKNWLRNGGWESNDGDWTLIIADTATVEYSRSIDNPSSGVGHGKLDQTAHTSGAVYLESNQGFLLEEGKTYQLSGSIRAEDAGPYTVSIRVVDEDGATITDANEDISADASWDSGHCRFTPTQDYPDARIRLVIPTDLKEYYFDDILFCELRTVNTAIVDKGHTLRGGSYDIQVKDHLYDSYTSVETGTITSDKEWYEEFSPTNQGAYFRIDWTGLDRTPEIPQLWLGERTNFTRNPTNYDPDHTLRTIKETQSEAGIVRTSHKFTEDMFDADWNHLHPVDDWPLFGQIIKDLGKGATPFFWFIWRPTSDPTDIRFIRLSGRKLAGPYSGHLRSFGIEGKEILGAFEV